MTTPSAPSSAAAPPETPPEPERLVLAGEFAAPDRDQWRALVAGVLRKSGVLGEDEPDVPVEDLLVTTTYDGIGVQPLYVADDQAPDPGLPGLPPFVRGGTPDGAVAAGWDVRQRHAHPDPEVTKAAILTDLECGVRSLWLVVGDGAIPVEHLPTVLHEVYLDLAPVALDAGAGFAAAAEALLGVYQDKQIPASEVRGSLGADPIGLLAATGAEPDLEGAAKLAARVAADHPNLRTITVDALPFHDAGGSDAQELGFSLAAAVAYLRALTGAGLDVDAAARQLEFRYAATADQFLTIAKFRAARRLWARVCEVSGAAQAPQAQHAVTSSAMMTRRDPWVNMLRTTLACFGAGVAGADAITVQPFDAAIGLPDAFAARIARNTHAVLLDESSVAGVIDPAGGSWYVERLTDQLAHAAWAQFTAIEAHGGIVKALQDGEIERRLAETWQVRCVNVATRADPITGVSEFPDVNEKPVVRDPDPGRRSGGLPKLRYAQAYEQLRDTADSRFAETGERPSVFLATIGPLAHHTARATFAANLFQAGGFATPTAGATNGVDDLVKVYRDQPSPVVCLCGTDKAYPDIVGPAAAALREAGAKKVYLAGKPRPEYSGVDGYVHMGCDALAVLADVTGVSA
ncbi:methylmalonyl-CoA mutase family protein [Labedaea rhizosphaerae]|uniref:Heterodimeric methylmalonyl-CoA mutase small subunit n=1 Tax=Labedaea rhizosphaerae TaxID=598644 RepID=A0A4R6S250_LABRH|nr:methylmalonyl-CoA mutase family protein [Labedaea rhizosphaerae]TDP93621.1 heterodimeric methylmalonyl-CoA mutase small subunit [Labedaea rhizosphaerae]